jgi:hypothetical protein
MDGHLRQQGIKRGIRRMWKGRRRESRKRWKEEGNEEVDEASNEG